MRRGELFRSRNFLFPLFFVTLSAFGADPTVPKVNEGSLPSFTNTQLPSIASCDREDPAAETASSGNGIIDAVTSTAKTVKGSFGQGKEEDDIDGKATIDTVCPDPGKSPPENAKDMACGVFKNDVNFLENKRKEITKSGEAYACQRGVLDALNKELVCFRKQLTAADKFIDSLVQGPGGLNDMLKSGNDQMTKIDQELQDRDAQLKLVGSRINGGEGGNPPGLKAAAASLRALSESLPGKVAAANNLSLNVLKVEAQAAASQMVTCLNTPVTSFRCVKEGSASTLYPAGSVSVMELIACKAAQSTNKVVNGAAVTNRTRETNLYKTRKADFELKAGTDIRLNAELSGETKSYAAAPNYTYNTVDEVVAQIGGKVASLGGAYVTQFNSKVADCRAKVATKIGQDKTSVEDALRNENASAYRALRNSYSDALYAATGKSNKTTMLGMANCETADLSTQAKCFKQLDSMVDCLYTGQSCAGGAGSASSLGMTSGTAPIKDFLGQVAATQNPNRTITVACSGITDCLAQYSSLQTTLTQVIDSGKQSKELFKTNLNQKIQAAATNLASGKDPNTGKDLGMAQTLNKVTSGIEAAKAKIMAALGKLKVKDSFSLDPKEIKSPEIDEKTGLYKPNDLRNLVLQGINPGLPDAGSKGIGDTTTAIQERDKEIEDKQDKLDKYIADLESAKAACVSKASAADCDTKKDIYHASCDVRGPEAEAADSTGDALAKGTPEEKALAARLAKLTKSLGSNSSKVGEQKSVGKSTGSPNICGRLEEDYRTCGKQVSENISKDDPTMGAGKKSGTGKKSGGLGGQGSLGTQ
ncbi:MAG: hypothetical protein H7301_02045 [Cryobacterium sp.]|nr:hypothetical protein [Oligoflexia bacterium]